MPGNFSTTDMRKEEALAWYVRLTSGHADDTERAAFNAWCAAHPDNDAEFQRISAFGQGLENARPAVLARFAQELFKPTSHRPKFISDLLHVLETYRPFPTTGHRIAFAALCIVAIGGLVFLTQLLSHPDHLATLTGEVRTQTLADGSSVTLDAESELFVNYTGAERRVELRGGGAFFEVFPDKGRPFIVVAGDNTVRAVGTQFEVALRDRALTVKVAKGTVAVHVSNGPVDDMLASRGQQVVLLSTGGKPVRSVIDPEIAGSWRRGQLVFDHTPLSTVVDRLNDYFNKAQIVVRDRVAGDLEFTGVLKIADAEHTAKTLSGLLPVSVYRDGDDFVVRGKTSED